MKKIIAYIAVILLVAGVTGMAQSAEYNAREDCCTEGPPYDRSYKQGPDIPTKVVDKGHLYIDGMGFAPRPEGPKTVVPEVTGVRDWCCEDMSKAEEEMHFRKANILEPAAGK